MLVDINRMLFGVHDTARLYRNFRSINIQSEHETVRFAEAYARVAGLDEERCAPLPPVCCNSTRKKRRSTTD